MKVLLFNGSPHKHGCTCTALEEISKTLQEEGIDSEIYQIGIKSLTPCRGCGACTQLGRCVINDDDVNNFVDRCKDFDGFIFGSPVHYASACGGITAFLDRAFFSAFMSGRGEVFSYKPAAAVVSARRSGTTATLDQLNKYMTISQMPIISGRYWNMVHGHTPDEVKQDLEGMQNMRILARNMAWHLKCMEAGKRAGVPMPKQEEIVFTNFIRG
ncbi:flavodoxin family protein [bacterium]|nr:flavodoxin family protein [bacterium]